jgi:hypothetical protein
MPCLAWVRGVKKMTIEFNYQITKNKKYLRKKIIYSQMQGLKFQIPEVGTDVRLS